MRPNWTNFWFVIALMYSTRGTCDRLRTACVIVKDKRLVGAGYNGSAHGLPHCDDVGHLLIDNHCERTLHGEDNAILNTPREDLKGASAYIVGTPCIRCARMLVNSGVKVVNFLGEYANSRGKEYMEELEKNTDVKFIQYQLSPEELLKQAVERLEGPGGAIRRAGENNTPSQV